MSLEKIPSFFLKFSEANVKAQNSHFYEFQAFRLNLSERQLLKDENPVSLTPKAFDVLAVLVEHAGHLVEKEELMQLVWPDSFVEETNVSRIIHTLRRTLGEDDNGNKFIETVPTKGYRFVAEVRTSSNSDPLPKIGALKTSSNGVAIIAEPQKRDGLRYRSLLVGIAIAVIFAGALGSYFFVYKRLYAKDAGRKSIAVIPFKNSTGDAGLDYEVDGTTDSVINQLTRISGLRVVAPKSIWSLKGQEISNFKDVAARLGVQDLVIGEVTQRDSQLRINVKLIDPNDDSLVWGREFVKDPLDVIATPNDISQGVVNSLHVDLTETEKRILAKIPTENAEAWQLYLRGRSAGQNQGPDGLRQSIDLNIQAIDKDPLFALAYSEMGMRYVNLGIYFDAPRQMMPKARGYAEKAKQLDDTLPDPFIVLGLVDLLYDWDPNKAKAELANGSVVNLRSMEAFSCTAHVLQITGQATEADNTLRRAIDDDPISIPLTTELACNSYYSRRFDESIKQYQEALPLDPKNFLAVYGLARSLNHEKQYQQAVDELDKAASLIGDLPPPGVAEKSYALAKLGRRDDAEAGLKLLVDAPKDRFIDPYFMATICLGLNDRDQTLTWLEKAFEVRSSFILSLARDARWDELRDDDRFQDLIRRSQISGEKPAS